MLAWEPDLRRSRAVINEAAAWQAQSSALLHARLEHTAEARAYLDLVPAASLESDNLFRLYLISEAAAIAGPRDLAAALYQKIRPLRDRCVLLGMSYMGWEGPWARILGLLAAHLGRWDDASAHFEDAIARCRRMDARPYLARTEYEFGRALAARGDRGRAREMIATARNTAEELGLTGLVRLADAKLSSLGAPAATERAADRPTNQSLALAFAFVREGEYWSVSFAGTTFRLKDSLGIQYLVRLIEEPGREIHVLDLTGERAAGGAGVNEAIDTGDAGELLDEEARRNYQRRLEDLEETVAEAESFGDAARASRARAEIEMLAAELGRAVGLGGRARRAGGSAERARSAVQRRIKNAIERVREYAPALATFLGRTIRTGNYCVFRPTP